MLIWPTSNFSTSRTAARLQDLDCHRICRQLTIDQFRAVAFDGVFCSAYHTRPLALDAEHGIVGGARLRCDHRAQVARGYRHRTPASLSCAAQTVAPLRVKGLEFTVHCLGTHMVGELK